MMRQMMAAKRPQKRRASVAYPRLTLLLVALISLCAVLRADLAFAQNTARAGFSEQGFDASAFNRRERRFLQIGLAASGDYLGLFDGSWGRVSQRALKSFAERYFGEATVDYGVVVELAQTAAPYIKKHQFDDVRLEEHGVTLFLPLAVVGPRAAQDGRLTWKSADSGLKVVFWIGALPRSAHEQYAEEVAGAEAYVVRRANRWVTARNFENWTGAYVRSERVEGGWATMMFQISEPEYSPFVRLMASGYYVGPRREWLSSPTPLVDKLVAEPR